MMNPIAFGPADRLVVLTGAGVSAESGLRTFRDNNGLWEDHRVEEVATPEAFAQDPVLVWRFYDMRRKQLKTAQPNPAHLALARLEQMLGPDRFLLVTQNVDDLHERGGSTRLCHMHGELRKIRCTRCGEVTVNDTDILEEDVPHDQLQLPYCECGGMLRPHIVWFGETPFEMEDIYDALSEATHFLSIGTSGVVYPAAGFLSLARRTGATTLGINLAPPENCDLFDHFYQGKAGDVVPQWVEALAVH